MAIAAVLGGCAASAPAEGPAPARGILSAHTLSYPPAQRSDSVDVYHGTRVPDPYRWLEHTEADATRTWVAAQNELSAGYLATLPERDSIGRLVSNLATEARSDVPFRAGHSYFALVRDGSMDQPVLEMRESLDAPAVTVLDVDEMFPGGTTDLVDHGVTVSPDGRLIAFGVAEAGSDWQVLRIRTVAGEDLPDRIEGMRTWHSATWSADSRGLFYTRQLSQDDVGVPREQLLYHRIGSLQAEDQVVFDRAGELPRARVSDDGRFLFVLTVAGNEPVNRLYYADLAALDPGIGPVSLLPLVATADATYQVIGNVGDIAYIATTLDAPLGRIVAVDTRRPARENWVTVLPETDIPLPIDPFIPMIHVVGDRILVAESFGTHHVINLYTLSGQPAGELPLPGPGLVGEIRSSRDRPELLFAFSRFPHPTTILRYDLESGSTTTVWAPASTFPAERYETRRVTYTSRDGTIVPMFITHAKDVVLDGSNPTYLTGYGGFGGSMGPSGDNRLRTVAWLALGGNVAVPSLRGGGEFGEEWHQSGTRERKQNVFDDFIAAAEFLIREGYTRPERLAISGTSNGGLLVAATLTQRPELFAAAVPDVAITDMLRSSQLPGGSIGAPEYGTPDTEEGFEYLYAYSPLHRVEPGTCYPATLVTTGLNDENVHPSHSLKFTAALQHALVTAQGSCGPVLLRAEADAGHGGGASAGARIAKAVDVLAFLVHHLRVPVLRSP